MIRRIVSTRPSPFTLCGWGVLLMVGAGLAGAQPPPPREPGQQSYQLVLEPAAEPQVRPLPLGQAQTRAFGEGSSVDNEGSPCDVWALQVEQPQVVRLTATSPAGDMVVKLFDNPRVFETNPLNVNDDMSGSFNSLLDHRLLPGQTYFVVVSGRVEGEAPGTYTLTATPFTPPAPRPLPWNETVAGHLGPQSASLEGEYCDLWTFAVTEPQVVLVALEESQGAALNVFVGPPERQQTAQKGWRTGPRKRIQAQPGVDYHVAVLATESEADYRLRIGPYVPPSQPPTQPLPANDTVTGELTEEDWLFLDRACEVWQVDGGDGKQMTLTCSGEDLDPLLAVFDTPDFVLLSDDPQLFEPIAADDDSGGNTAAQLSFEAEPGRPYYVLVTGYDLGTYQLQIESAPLPPLKRLPLDEVVASTLTGEVEVWEFTAPAAGLVTVRMNSTAFDALLQVKPGRGSSQVLAEDDDSGGDWNPAVSFLAEAARTYFIHARATVSLGPGGGGAYTLEATSTPAPPVQTLTSGVPVNGAVPEEPGARGSGWTFTAPATQRVLLRLSDLEFDPRVVVRVGGPTGEVVAHNSFMGTVVFRAEAGTVYYIQVEKRGEWDLPDETMGEFGEEEAKG